MRTKEKIAAALVAAREHYRESGYDVDRITIGQDPFAPTVRLCDDAGAYDFTIRGERILRQSIGNVSSTLQGIAYYRALTELGTT